VADRVEPDHAMRVTALGHAGLRVDTGAATVLVDPWVSPFGAFQASWFPFPDNRHVVDDELFRPAAVVLSHEHLDHLDPWFLTRLDLAVPVFVPRYPGTALVRKVTSCRDGRLVAVEPGRWVEVADGVRLLFVAESSPMNHDAAVVLVGGGGVLVDLNDARLSPAQLRATRAATGPIDVLALQTAGASWHPMCYELAPDRRRALSRQKRVAKLAYALRAVQAAEPAAVLPIAGPPCFLDPELAHHNDEMDGGVFPDQAQSAAWLARRGVEHAHVLLPGDAWDTAAAGVDRHPAVAGFSFDERRDHLADYARRRAGSVATVLEAHPPPSSSLWEPFRTYFERLLDLSPYFNERIAMRVGFDITGPGGGAWSVDLRTGRVHDELGDCGYRLRFASRWLPPLLDGSVPWEDFLLSLRFSAHRDPDVHNEHLLGLLKFAERDALDAVEVYETADTTGDRMLVETTTGVLSVQRTCPHAGADLLDTSELLPGPALRCLNHYYEFDLESGRCRNGACPGLDVRRAQPGEAAPVMVAVPAAADAAEHA
jgi:UDP-MurNAc hydroxylase